MKLWRAIQHELRLFFVALQFLTRLPAPAWVGYDPAWLNRSMRHLPLVGAIVGAAGAAVACAASLLWSPLVSATLAVAFTVWLTAAFHEDGLADTFDALLGAAPREKALAIMKDSRIGSYGAAVLILALILRVALLAELLARGPLVFAALGLIAAHAAGRAAAVVLMAASSYAGDEAHAKAKPLARAVRGVDAGWAVASALLLTCATCLAGPASLARLAAVVVALTLLVMFMRRWLRQRLGGYTGDTLGATEQFGEILVLMVFASNVTT